MLRSRPKLICSPYSTLAFLSSLLPLSQARAVGLFRSERSVSAEEGAVLLSVDSRAVAQHEEPHSQRLDLHQQLQHAASWLATQKQDSDTMTFLRAVSLCRRCQNYQRFGESHDGGYVMCMDGLNESLQGALSFGVSGYDGWGMQVAQTFGIPVHEFDCYDKVAPAVCDGCKVQFHPECIRAVNDPQGPDFKTLSQQLAATHFNAAPDGALLMKLDVENAEWLLLVEEPIASLRKFRQIVVEFHNTADEAMHGMYVAAVRKLEMAGFVVTHLHGNNYGPLVPLGEYSIPAALEVTFVRGDPSKCDHGIPYHVPEDARNNFWSWELADARLPGDGQAPPEAEGPFKQFAKYLVSATRSLKDLAFYR